MIMFSLPFLNDSLYMKGSIPAPAGTTGLPFARVGEAIINVPADDVAETWWYWGARKQWDSLNTSSSQVVEEYGPSKRIVYIKGGWNG